MPSRNNIPAGLVRLDRTIRAALASGLQTGAAKMTAALHATTAHGDVTGATRASYIAYEGSDGQAFDGALAAASAANPAHTEQNSIGVRANALVVVATSATDYQVYLERGANAAIGPVFAAGAPALAQAAFDAVRKVL